jgi:hypothetical protein
LSELRAMQETTSIEQYRGRRRAATGNIGMNAAPGNFGNDL